MSPYFLKMKDIEDILFNFCNLMKGRKVFFPGLGNASIIRMMIGMGTIEYFLSGITYQTIFASDTACIKGFQWFYGLIPAELKLRCLYVTYGDSVLWDWKFVI